MGDLAVYIEDAKDGEVTVCGTVTEITERQTKSEKPKPYFIIHIDDTTGRTSGIYFSRKSTCQKIRDITIGEDVIMRGSIENKDGRKSFRIDKINRCTFPKNFVKKDKFKKPVPDKYTLIFPEPVTTVKMSSVFDLDEQMPKSLMENEYVVFDIETTGLDLMSNGITEIGAVKVRGGKKVEQFTTLIKPDYHIDAENEKITGINEEMVKDSPKISAVMPDFIKFIDGTILVAHNAQFDMGFIRRFANAEEFEVKNRVMDTMNLARETVPSLKRVGLKEVADHFNVVFHHHRALSDAHATADVFIEMMKIKG
jgi:DNA polymerase III epsilon subunit family exonuclease